MLNNIKLTYFDAPGRAEVARLCFHLGNIKFTDQRLSYEQFSKLKQQGEFKFTQVPVLYVNGKQYAQSGAIYRYAARLSNLYPEDPIEALKVEQALFTLDEISNRYSATYAIQDDQQRLNARQDLAQNEFPKWYERIENLLKENATGYFSGHKITVADIALYVAVSKIMNGSLEGTNPSDLDRYQLLKRHYNVIKLNKKIQEWENSHQQ